MSGIPSHFAKMYKWSYNCIDDEDNQSRIEESIEGKITQRSNGDICQITTELLKTASQKLKSGKSDSLLNVTSDFFLNAPPILHDMLTAILRGYITHAHVSDFLLVSNLIPIVKDKLADVTNSNNYRTIAISSLVMKIFG